MAQRKRVRPASPAVSRSSPLPASSPAPSSPAPSSLCLGQRKRYRRESSAGSSTEGARVHPSRSSPPVSSPPPPGIDPCSKKAKFERQFKTATSSNEDVSVSPDIICMLQALTKKTGKQMKSWTSSVYAHFRPPSIVDEDGKVTYVFVCKRCVMRFHI